MPGDKIIDVPGVGTVSFPGEMDDKAIGDAIQTHMLKTGQGMEHPTAPQPLGDPEHSKMQESAAPKYARAATSTLPAVGAMASGLVTSPSIIGTAAGAGLGAAAGKQAELLANRAMFGPTETSPISGKGLMETGKDAALAAGTTGLMGAIAHGPELGERTARFWRDPNTGKVTVTPSSILERAIPKIPEEPSFEPETGLEKGPSIPIRNSPNFDPSEYNAGRKGLAPSISGPEQEGIEGAVPKFKGRLVLSEQEANTADRMQALAKQKASERGMIFAGGGVPAEGRTVPRFSTPTNTLEYENQPKFRKVFP